MSHFIRFLGKIFMLGYRFFWHCLKTYQMSLFEYCGSDVYIGKSGIFTYHNISIGNDVYIGANACFQSAHGKIQIGDHVMFGPGVHIHGGNHKFNVLGKWMKELTKQEGEDGLVVVQDDVWIGANAIILKNVTIGEGSIIGAGAVVTHDVPPYSIYTGVPQAKLRQRFSTDTILQHKEILKKRGVLG